MARTALWIVVGIALIATAEALLVAYGGWRVPVDFTGSLSVVLAVTGTFIVLGSLLSLVGPSAHTSHGSTSVLVSSGTRSLWDQSRSYGRHISSERALTGIGIGLGLLGLGLALALL